MIGWLVTVLRVAVRGVVGDAAARLADGAVRKPQPEPERKGWTYRDVQHVQGQIERGVSHGTVPGSAAEREKANGKVQ